LGVFDVKLGDAVREAARHNRLALILYTIPNYPDRESYARLVTRLSDSEGVTIVETTVPVGSGFSAHANDVIRGSHRRVVAAGTRISDLHGLPQPRQPTLCVLYRETLDRFGMGEFLEKTKDLFDGLLPEWDEPDGTLYLRDCEDAGVELVQCVGPWMPRERVAELVRLGVPNPLVYLMSAPMTGATLFSTEELERTIAWVREDRPDAQIAAGFGIRDGKDVDALKAVRGLDGVIVGTTFLRALGDGEKSTEALLSDLERSIVR
jgi:tryptophan synthase alpha subunit